MIEHTEAVQYRKKPIVITAMQYNGTNAAVILRWIGQSEAAKEAQKQNVLLAYVSNGVLYVQSHSGVHTAEIHDWIIKGVQGEFYPCQAAIFDATYERV